MFQIGILLSAEQNKGTMNTYTHEFSVVCALKLFDALKTKQSDYFTRIKGPNGAWHPSWKDNDLVAHLDTDQDFRLRYYKFVIISTVIIGCENYTKTHARSDGLFEIIHAHHIASDLERSLNRTLDPDEFNTACEVIGEYISGERSIN